jgi:hypothetical protein
MTQGFSSHGTLIFHEITPGGAFTVIGDLGADIQPPGFNRAETDITPHNDDIDTWVFGPLLREPMTFGVNYLPESTAHITLLEHIRDKVKTGYKLVFTDTGATEWIFSGFVRNFVPRAPVRTGALTADITVRASGPHIIEGTLIS